MGSFLDKPKTEKHTEQGSGNGLQYGVSSMQGWRIEMEDAHCAVVGINGLKDWSFFAVFDGHAGPRVSAHCAEHLLDSIIQAEDFRDNANSNNGNDNTSNEIESIKAGIRDGFLKLDENMKCLPEVASGTDKSGTTAVCCIISPKHFFFANCGDSRAVLSRSNTAYFSTQDHKPINPEEKDRIIKAGGSVMIQRVNGSLAVSRALGDYEYKQVEGKGPCEQLVSPEPEITVQERDDNNDEFLILACDGIWDVMKNNDLCDYVRHQLRIESNLEVIASSIIDICLIKGSKDNMSVVLVKLPGAPQINEEAQKLDQELNQKIQQLIEAELKERTEPYNIFELSFDLSLDDLPNLPPGVGIAAKYSFIDECCQKFQNKEN